MFSFRTIGPFMRKKRKESGYTIKQIAAKTGMNADTISDLENQKTNMKILGLLDQMVKLYHIDEIPSDDEEYDLFSKAVLSRLSPGVREKIVKIIEEDLRGRS